MSCTSLRTDILSALKTSAEGNIQKARINIEVYLHNPVGIGEHPDVLAAIQDQLDVIAHEEERIQVIEKHFSSHTHTDS
jgi:hypothetical protein